MMLRVVVGDDSYLAREGISRILERVEDVELVATCSDAATLLATIDELRPDVVLTDIRMPPTGTDEGIRVAEQVRTSHPEIGVVVLSQYAEPTYAAALFASGSDRRAYLLKERLKDRGELSRAIREVAAGGSVVDPRVVEKLLAARKRNEDANLASLTPREHEILAMIAEGRSNGAIAETLAISKRAVEHHVNAIFVKLELGETKNISRRVKAAVMYLTDG